MLHDDASATTIFSAMQHCNITNIAATLFRMVATLFQYSNAVLRETLSLRMVLCSITFRENHKEKRPNRLFSMRTQVVCQYEFDTLIQVVKGSLLC